MKRKLLVLILPFTALFILSSSMMSDNGKAAKTGSPNELTCTDCHGSYTLNSGGGSISLQSPGTPGFQYTPGQTYNMSVTVSKSSILLFGVGIEALTSTNNNGGTLNITDPASTQIKSATVSGVLRRNIVHTLGGGIGSGSKVFNFSWTAPTAGTGNVTFYFAGVAANGTGSENGDWVYASSQVFTESTCQTPAQPGTMTGDNTVCSGTSQTYSVPLDAGATSYTWTLPSGWVGTSTTNSITATAGNSSGTIAVTANNVCGGGPQRTFAVTSSNIIAATNSTNVSCFGGSNGTATVIPTGGAGGYSYAWSPSGGTSATASNLSQGTYTCTITDGSACTKTASVTITQPPSALTLTSTPVAATCSNTNGSITASPAGGTGTYTYSWSPSGGTMATANVPAGTYVVTVTDAAGCTKTSSATVTAPAPINANVIHVNALCASDSGSASATPSGGQGPYTYLWSPGGKTTATIIVPAGTYTVTVTDTRSCTSTQSVAVTQPAPVTVTISSTYAGCNATSGTATAIPSGGTGSFSYSWSTVPVQNSATAINLAGGNYSVTVSDSNGCAKIANTQIFPLAPLTGTTNSSMVTCYNENNGRAVVSVSGGSPLYAYLWNTIPIQTNDTASNLSAGTYSVTVTDSAGCIYNSNVTITQPTQMIVNSGPDSSICSGNTITLNGSANGGTSAYTYLWSPVNGLSSATDSTPDATPSATTPYSLTVTDANGCTSSSTVTISLLPIPTASITMTGDSLFASGADYYYWYMYGNAIPVATGSSYYPTQNGDYYVIASNMTGCSDTSAIFTVSTVGISDAISDASFKIYPNPASGYLVINVSSELINNSATIFDVCGKPVMNIDLKESSNYIDLSGIAKGYYTIVVNGKDVQFTRAIIKN